MKRDANDLNDEELLRLLDGPADPKNNGGAIDVFDLHVKDTPQDEPVIGGLHDTNLGFLRRKEVANIISGSKVSKSWLLMSLAIQKAIGGSWLGFQMEPGRTLLLDYELTEGTFLHRLRNVAGALGVGMERLKGKIMVKSWRGEEDRDLETFFLRFKPREFDLTIIDPLYKTNEDKDFDENSNAQMAMTYNRLMAYAKHLDAGMLIVHHSTKGDQSGKDVADIGAGAGAQSRAADIHLAIRRHKEEDVAVVDMLLRSFFPICRYCVKWDFPIWTPTLDYDPDELHGQKPEKGAPLWDAQKFFERMDTTPRTVDEILRRFDVTVTKHKALQYLRAGIMNGLVRQTVAGRVLTYELRRTQ